MTYFAVQHLLAGSVGDVELKVFSGLISLPEGQGLGSLLIVAVSDERIPRTKGTRHVACQRRKEFVSSRRSRSNHNGTKRIFSDVAVRDITNQSDHTHDFAAGIEVRSESARLPNIMAVGSMCWNQSVRDLHNLACKRTL